MLRLTMTCMLSLIVFGSVGKIVPFLVVVLLFNGELPYT